MREKDIPSIVSQMTLDEKVALCTGSTAWSTLQIPRLGVPSIRTSDGTNGIRFQKHSESGDKKTFYDRLFFSFDDAYAIANTYEATCFPCGSALACSWDRDLILRVAAAVAEEAKALNIQLLLGPGLNLRRHPLTARNYEYFSEDPCLSGEIAAAYVRGLQDNGVGACIKHFACHNSDSLRTRVNCNVSPRALHELYMEGFRRAVKAHPLALMTSYNKVNGHDMSGDNPLIRSVVRGEWHYDGMIVCDYGGIKDILAASRGGIDLQMPSEILSSKVLYDAVSNGEFPLSFVDERVEHILRAVFRAYSLPRRECRAIAYDAQHALAVEACAESIVLLKNDGRLLPLCPDHVRKIAVIGEYAMRPLYQGTGCAIVNTPHADVPYEEIYNLAGKTTTVTYSPGYLSTGPEEDLLREAVAAASDADVAIIFVGSRLPLEDDDYNRKNMSLDDGHDELVEQISMVQRNTIVIVCSGDAVLLPWCNHVKSVLSAMYGGEGMGSAIAEILFGKRVPCGHLTVTFPKAEEDTPAYLSFNSNSLDLIYGEDIFAGYRYYQKKKCSVLFPFGHGLSYTEFDFCAMNCRIDEAEEILHIDVSAKNIGAFAGKAVVQIYIEQKSPSLSRPIHELKAFGKVFLSPGETAAVSFDIPVSELGYYSPEHLSWVTENDTYIVKAGLSCEDILLSTSVLLSKQVQSPKRIPWDAAFRELFSSDAGNRLTWDFLIKHGLLTKEQATAQTEERLTKTFWSVRSYLDSRSDNIRFEEIDELIAKINFENGYC